MTTCVVCAAPIEPEPGANINILVVFHAGYWRCGEIAEPVCGECMADSEAWHMHSPPEDPYVPEYGALFG